MRPESGAQAELDVRMTKPELIASRGQVADEVDSLREEIGDHQDPRRSARDAAFPSAWDIGLGQLEEARLHDRIIPTAREPIRQLVEVIVRGCMAAAVRDQQHGRP